MPPPRVTGSPATHLHAGWSLPAISALAALALVATGPGPVLVAALYLAVVTPSLYATDVAEHRLPNRLVLPGYPVALAACAGSWLVAGEAPLTALVAGASYFVALLTMAVAGGMGMGDVKLAGVLGLSAGLLGSTAAVTTFVAGFLLGGVAAIAALRRGAAEGIPFGPHMLAGYWIALAFSTNVK